MNVENLEFQGVILMIAANYGTSTAKCITPFNWATIHCSASSVSESNYNHTILDSGRTAALYFHAVILGLGGWTTYVDDFYAEFS